MVVNMNAEYTEESDGVSPVWSTAVDGVCDSRDNDSEVAVGESWLNVDYA